jgi:hypothetical protein
VVVFDGIRLLIAVKVMDVVAVNGMGAYQKE